MKFQEYDIATLEMANILIALKVWAKDWAHFRIEIHCDNLAVVSVLQSGKTRDPMLATISRNIFMIASNLISFLKYLMSRVKQM